MLYLEGFSKIAPYLTHPLSLVGFALFLFFGIHWLLIKSGIIPPVSKSSGSLIIQALLRYGFVIALTVIVLGFSMEVWKTHYNIKKVKEEIVKIEDKIGKAKKLIVSEVLANIINLDARLTYLDQTSEPDEFGRLLNDIRNKVAPSSAEIGAMGYETLIAEQKVASLRQLLNSNSLRTEFGQPLIQELQSSGINSDLIRTYFDQLLEVQRSTEFLLESILFVASINSNTEKNINYRKHRLNVAIENLYNKSMIAYMISLRILLQNNEYLPIDTKSKLASLRHLKPITIPEEHEIAKIESKLLAQGQKLVTEKAILAKEAEELRNETLKEYSDINHLLKIRPTDQWNEVVGKAVSLRQLGRMPEAVAAFARYAEMFSKSDPGATQYAEIAQKFTIHMEELSVKGGVYIVRIKKNSLAEKFGLKIGDILVEYGGNSISNMDELVRALNTSQLLDYSSITYLRVGSTGTIEQKNTTLPKGEMGAGFMPI